MSLWPLSNSHSHMYVPASCRVAVLIFRLDDNPSMGFTVSSSSMVFPSFRQVISPSGVAAERGRRCRRKSSKSECGMWKTLTMWLLKNENNSPLHISSISSPTCTSTLPGIISNFASGEKDKLFFSFSHFWTIWTILFFSGARCKVFFVSVSCCVVSCFHSNQNTVTFSHSHFIHHFDTIS